MVRCVILAGGVGSRVGELLPKQLLCAYGKTTILEISLRTYQEHPEVTAITLVCTADHMAVFREIADKYDKVDTVIQGGGTRQDSSRIGTQSVQETYVLVQDAARPIVRAGAVTECIHLLRTGQFSVVNTVFLVTSSMALLSDDGAQMIGIVPRDNLALGQCPQGFVSRVLREAHGRAATQGETHHEDCMMVRDSTKLEVGVVQGHEAGFKITYPGDIKLLRHFVAELVDQGPTE